MIRRLYALAGCGALILCASCSGQKPGPKDMAPAAAAQQIKSIHPSTPEDAARWGLRDWEFIGSPRAVGGAEEVGPPPTFSVPVRAWCRGTRPDGTEVQVRRRLVVSVAQAGGEDDWRLVGYTVDSDEPLSFGRQAYCLAILCLTVPPLVYMGLCALFLPWDVLGYRGFAGLWGLGCLVWAGVAGYECFGSAGAVLVSVLAYALVHGAINGWYAHTERKEAFIAVWIVGASLLGVSYLLL
jgi:hypothetical protein